jgi:hypothetical protein
MRVSVECGPLLTAGVRPQYQTLEMGLMLGSQPFGTIEVGNATR